ncbi:MAG: hypothetical protein DWQ34_09135 [Planctomycetota bacterium]|nr:MAG: hypothetical protein DWQ29_14495 [Planctomycetota bacterium]REJ94231.1 MAG: hypothetical protein DWQ34_09135 [Planctomycetota bacterium]REK20211.1 MAG: hypothetical protein DWQ41_26070 [Planctomycetota bacterium]REK35335.1 MAG: hypothetical protein DWQ45_11450 [Planctomycetota bacterium]
MCSLAACNVASAQQPLYGTPYNGYNGYYQPNGNYNCPGGNCNCPGGNCHCPGGVCNTNPYAPASQTICGPDGCYSVPAPRYNSQYDPRYAPNTHSTYRYPARPATNSNGIFPFNLFGNMFRSRTPQPAYTPPVYRPPTYRPAPQPTYPGYPGSAGAPNEVGTLY